MSTDFMYADGQKHETVSGHREGRTAWGGRTPAKADKLLIRLGILVAGILVIELVWLCGIAPLLPLSAVEVTGISGIDRTLVLSRSGISSRSSYFTVNTAQAEKNLSELYQVESVRVVKRYPDTVQIFLEPRLPVALSLVNSGKKLVPVYLDKRGMIIGFCEDGKEGMTEALPIISGLEFERLSLGAKPLAPMENFFARLDALNNTAPELLALISEIRVNKKIYNGFDLVLYPVNSGIKFRLEPELNEDSLRYMILMIDVFKETGLDVDEVDLRNGTASYVVKEAYSG
jgi:cell division protein FtsQ